MEEILVYLAYGVDLCKGFDYENWDDYTEIYDSLEQDTLQESLETYGFRLIEAGTNCNHHLVLCLSSTFTQQSGDSPIRIPYDKLASMTN